MSRLADLTKLREDLLGWMDDAPADRKAALVAQFRATLAELEELTPKEAVGDSIDEISQRRAARRTRRVGRPDRSAVSYASCDSHIMARALSRLNFAVALNLSRASSGYLLRSNSTKPLIE